MSRDRRLLLPALLILMMSLVSLRAGAWSIGTVFKPKGCHEAITANALRSVRGQFDTAPAITPTRDEAALISLVVFEPPADFTDDLAAMSLILGVRDNDIKDSNPLDTLTVVEINGDPDKQEEHCIRSASNDGVQGEEDAMAACRAFILMRATQALDGLDENGVVDGTNRIPLDVYVNVSGVSHPPLPLFYLRIGQAMHALEDGFTHTWRTADGSKVTTVLNWIDWVNNTLDMSRDGPPHMTALDQCDHDDPLVQRNYALATQAATELLTAALDPSLTHDQKVAQFDAITTTYLSFQEGCTYDNNWCDAPEAKVTAISSCAIVAIGGRHAAGAGLVLLLFMGVVAVRRRRGLAVVVAAALALGLSTARADEPTTIPAPGAPNAPVVPTPPKPEDAVKAEQGKEPGRDIKTPTVKQVEDVREDKRLGPALGFALSIGGSYARPAGIARVGLRYRLTERWLTGLDAEWNPWILSQPLDVKMGSLNVSGVIIRRFPMLFNRVNLRSSLRLGVSTLLFDVYGAPKYSTGPFFGVSVLGLDVDVGNSWRIVFEPAEIAVPLPKLTPIPLYYEQYRFMIGLQYGS